MGKPYMYKAPRSPKQKFHCDREFVAKGQVGRLLGELNYLHNHASLVDWEKQLIMESIHNIRAVCRDFDHNTEILRKELFGDEPKTK